MTIAAQNGIFGFGLQNFKSTHGSYSAAETLYYRHRASDINYGPVQDLRTFPLEVGGIITPTGAYKGGFFMGGGATIQPRMEGDLGYLLKGLMGKVTTTSLEADLDTAAHAVIDAATAAATSTAWTQPESPRQLVIYGASMSGTCTFTIAGTDDNDAVLSEAGLTVTTSHLASAPRVTTKKFKTITSLTVTSAAAAGDLTVTWYKKSSHAFTFETDSSELPWMSVVKYVPGSSDLWEKGIDNKVTAMRFNFPQNGILQSRVDFLGREPDWTDPGVSTWNAAYEDFHSVPITCTVGGYIKLPSYSASELPITSLVVAMSNNLTSPQQEMIIGSPFPDDYIPLSRAATFQATLKWSDPDLYRTIMTGSTSGTAWDPEPFTSDLDVFVQAAHTIPETASDKYSLQIEAPNVMWNVAGPPTLAGGDIVMLQLIGTALAPSSGEYLTFTLVNENSYHHT